jgi:hypothetical protein
MAFFTATVQCSIFLFPLQMENRNMYERTGTCDIVPKGIATVQHPFILYPLVGTTGPQTVQPSAPVSQPHSRSRIEDHQG